MFLPVHGVTNRLAFEFEHAFSTYLPAPGVNVDIVFNLRKNWIEYLIERRGEYRKHGGKGLGVLSGHDFQKRFALLRIGFFIDNGLALAFTFVNRPRPLEHNGYLQTVKPHLAMVAFFNRNCAHRFAESGSGQRTELARAPVRAVAVDQLSPLNFPWGHFHLLCYRTDYESFKFRET
jgi:hypothetical protein